MSKPAPVHGDSPRPSSPESALLCPSRRLTASRVALPVHGVSTTRATTSDPGSQHQPAGQDADPAWLRGLGGRSCVGRRVLLCRCCDRPHLGAAESLGEVNHAVLAEGAVPVPLLCGLPAGRACGQGLGGAMVPERGVGSSHWLIGRPGSRAPRQWLVRLSEIQGACSSTVRRVA
jgi:hypothetical protein